MLKILHVDDMEAWREIVKRVLEEAGHSVASYSTLADAKAASTGDFDVFVVDGSVDYKNDGLSWAFELKQGGKRVVVLSADPPEVGRIDSVDKYDLDHHGSALVKLVS